MRNNKHKWSFYDLPSRRSLTAAEVQYWVNTLRKIMKIGIEFEYNLPEKKTGTCKGDSNTCPCRHMVEGNECWKVCVNKELCEVTSRTPDLCANTTSTCEAGDCKTCEHFVLSCPGIYCSNFLSHCFVCQNFEINCNDCVYRYDPNKNPEKIRKLLTADLKPNNTYGLVGPSGVHSVTTDGSLLGKKGAEIITVGRRVDYWEFFRMASNIIDLATKRGAYLNERCSIHMHALASYYGKIVDNQENSSIPARVNEMERDLPEIVLANLHQLIRRYQNAMTWMVMGLNTPERMTRWEKFRVGVLPISAVMSHMRKVVEDVSSHAGGNKYGWINYSHVGFSETNDIRRFHVEFRAADGLNSPSAVAAIACMYYALIIKAVEISRYGIVEIGDKDWMSQAQTVKDALLNNMKSYSDGDRFSDTSSLYRYYEILVNESLDLVHQLKAILIKVGPAYEILEKLAERPCALRLVEGQTWDQIENDLKVITNEEGRFEIALNEVITLNQVAECSNLDEWVQAVNQILIKDSELSIDPDNDNVDVIIKNYVEKKREDGELIWSKSIGAPILI